MKSFNDKITILKQMINDSSSIAFFTGAGISTLSGIPDFRGNKGLYSSRYQGYKPEKILSIKFFNKHPDIFYAYYRDKLLLTDKDPNIVHLFISELQEMNKDITVVTQNIDGLHEKAGSIPTYNLHGSIYRNYCCKCNKEYDISYIKKTNGIPRCTCGGIIRPGITFYGEMLDKEVFKQARLHSKKADTLIVMGTSLVVYPASEIVSQFRGRNLVIINKKRTKFDFQADLAIQADFLDVFNALFTEEL